MFAKHRKTMSNSSKFVMAEGRRAGNLKAPVKNDGVKNVKPATSKQRGRDNLGELGKIK